MPKRERERAAALRRATSFDRVLEDELDEVLSSVKTLVPQLLARRASVAAELARVDAALARLTRFDGTPATTRVVSAKPRRRAHGTGRSRAVGPVAHAAAPSKRVPRPRREAGGKRPLSDLVIEILSEKGPLALPDLSRAIASKNGGSASGLPRLLWLLKKRNLIRVEGTRGSFRYTTIPSR